MAYFLLSGSQHILFHRLIRSPKSVDLYKVGLAKKWNRKHSGELIVPFSLVCVLIYYFFSGKAVTGNLNLSTYPFLKYIIQRLIPPFTDINA